MTVNQDLLGKTAVITGAARGIGKAVAISLHSRGCNIVIADNHEENAAKTCRELATRCTYHVTDVSQKSDVVGLMEHCISKFGGIDILVNNAGVDDTTSILDMDVEEWDRVMNINLRSVFLCSKYALPSMIQRGGGCIISMSSIVARQGAMNGGIHYASSKGGILGFTKTLARQMSSNNIRVNAITAGVVDTDLIQEHMAPEVRTKIENAIPMKRLAKTSEIGEVVAFLASDQSSYMTGATIDVNGGFWIG